MPKYLCIYVLFVYLTLAFSISRKGGRNGYFIGNPNSSTYP